MVNFRTIIMPHSLTVEVCDHIFRSLEINITKSTFSELLEAHANYPSLLSIQDTMDYFRVPNKIIKYRQEKFGELECPFLVLIKDPQNEQETLLSYVASVDADFIKFFDPIKRKLVQCNYQEFAYLYQGIIILVESDGKAGEVNYKFHRQQEKKNEYATNILIWFLPVISIIGIFQYLNFNSIDKEGWYLLFFLLLSLFGWSLSVVILIYERKTKPDDSFISKVCKRTKTTKTSIATDCHKVLRSVGSSILGVKWSVWGLGYFTALVLTQLFYGVSSSVVSVSLAAIALLASSYIIYSVYYQWKVLKSWCTMCLIVQLTLLLHMIVALILLQTADVRTFSLGTALVFILLFILILAATEFIIALIDRLIPLKSLQKEYLRNKYDPNVFFAKSKSQRQIDIPLDGMGLTFGNPNASNKLVKVCNPYCGPCGDSHRVISRFWEDIPDLFVQIVFAGAKDFSDVRNRPIAHFLSLFESKDEQFIKSALDDWYLEQEKDYDAFAKKYPVLINESSIKEKLNNMLNWCDKMDISYTPTFFFNGYLLPQDYTVSDIKRFMV